MLVTIQVIKIRIVPVASNEIEAPEPTPKLPTLVHLEGWCSDGQLSDGRAVNAEGGQPCNR
jgi:hypothetical protein